MPTGYTRAVADGTVSDLRTFAHPDDRPDIEDEYKAAQTKLVTYIGKLEEQVSHDPR